MRWSREQYSDYMAKVADQCAVPTSSAKPMASESDEGPESKLQAKIEAYLKERGFYFIHDRSRKVNRAGQPDLVVALRNGRVLWLELKAKHGRLSPEQQMTRKILLALGHEFYEIRSFRAFLVLVKGAK